MSSTAKIHLGYEIGTGKPIEIPVKHMCVTGQTQMSGKTTTLEALITRSGLRALAFVTKRGEGSFNIGRPIAPYFKDAGDWQFVEALLEASLKEKNKFQRAWVQKACRGASTLADVQRNTKRLMKQATRSMDQDQYMLLDSYFDIVVPQIAKLPKSPTLHIQPGLNVMDLTAYTQEMQMLVVRSAIEWVHKHEQNVITIIPEAWKFVPEGKGSPVKASAIALVREGAGLKNFIWLDSQDIAGVDKTLLRAATVWVIGVQREKNEVERTLDNIPGGTKQPRASDIQTLKIGQFFACFGDDIHKTYVQPAWMSDEDAKAIAMGKKRFDQVKPVTPTLPQGGTVVPSGPNPQDILQQLQQLLIQNQQQQPPQYKEVGGNAPLMPPATVVNASFDPNTEALYQSFKDRLAKEAPGIIKLLQEKPEINVEVEKKVLNLDAATCRGSCAQLIAEGFFDNGRKGSEVESEFKRRGRNHARPNMYRDLNTLTADGFLTKGEDGVYQAVKGMKVNIVTK